MAELPTSAFDAWTPRILSVLRIVTAVLFIEHGTQKLFAFPPGGHGVVEIASLMGAAGILEAGGGLLVLLGLFTRPVSFLLSGQMAVAYWMAHAPKDPFPANNGGDAAILFCFVFLYLFVRGPGPWSLDAMLRNRSRTLA